MNKKNLFPLFVAVCLIAVLFGCGKASQKENSRTVAVQSDSTLVMEVDDLLANAESLVGKEVAVSGVCTHICRHGGKKLFLMGSDDTQTIRIEAGEAIGSFSADAANSLVHVTGLLQEQRIDEAYLSDWEAELKAETAEEHGEEKSGCAAEKQAHNEAPADSPQGRIDNFRKRIAERNEKEGKNYLSFYYIEGNSYEIK